jgi:hypothetical protein
MPARSIHKRQADYLKTLHLEELGESMQDLKVTKMEDLEMALLQVAALFKILAQANLDAQNAVDRGLLGDSIQFDEVQYMGGVYAVDISVLDYYDFVNQGVHGVSSSHLSAKGSPYKYKNLYVSKSFMQSIRKWIIRHGLKSSARPVKKKPIGTERKTLSFENSSNAMAYAVATSIKKKGLRGTHFWDDAITELQKQMPELLGDGLAIAIVNTIASKK